MSTNQNELEYKIVGLTLTNNLEWEVTTINDEDQVEHKKFADLLKVWGKRGWKFNGHLPRTEYDPIPAISDEFTPHTIIAILSRPMQTEE